MVNFASLSALALAISSVSGLVVPRVPDASDWNDSLEDYPTYHSRYLAAGCQNRHSDVAFFDRCCHPLPMGSNPDSYCGSSSATSGSGSDTGDDDDCDDDDDNSGDEGDDHDPPSSTPSDEAKVANVDVTASTSASGYISGGFATFYNQNGNAGACGQYHSDNDLIAAMDVDRYGNTSRKSSLCGKRVRIINTKNGKSVTVTVADACPTCDNGNSIDLSVAAFKRIATLDEGEVPIKWQYV
ncbi:hypothetical protein D9756_001519 [Leucocoprinus leucothites]|uniref:Expansin-like EG45 domain-containing protein n=1 Tax=Leucocoprinus leucothites TaxID=201217 RepID=A0A8H5G432_9AGAR|nr:hypothetical protein D9756_001519 [Leucoagaricus leucothites]